MDEVPQVPGPHTPELEVALLRRGLLGLIAERERCGHCGRSPLVGEQLYIYDSGGVLCELCRMLEPVSPRACRTIHGPEFGHTLRITDRRAA